jgi:Cu+-exporting ATPase
LTFQRLEAPHPFELTGTWECAVNIHAESPTLKPTTVAVTGMTCGSCARAVERALSGVPGVKSAAVDFDLGLAIVNGSAVPSELIAAVEAAGYGASVADESAIKGENNERRRLGCC